MFELTRQERGVLLFLITIALIGIGVNFVIKINSPAGEFLRVSAQAIKVDINRATQQELAQLLNIRPKLASKIIGYRKSHGRFYSLEELKEIKGIGNVRYEKLKELFYVK